MKVDDDDRIGSSWRTPGIGRMEWLGIITLSVMMGGLLHDGARMLITNAWVNYQLEKFKAEQAKTRQPLPPHHPAHEIARIKAAEAAERARKLNSDECRFWIQQNVISPNQRTADKVAIHCR